ncbi:MAG: hypothetical protein IJW36_01970 [Clostridia bacterium]|nr:hypothetical protein [Clostridia bacterium]
MEILLKKYYDEIYEKYAQETIDTTKKLTTLIETFNTGKEKGEIIKQIVSTLRQEDKVIVSRDLPYLLLEPILYALDIQDVDTAAVLMRARMQMESAGVRLCMIKYRPAEHIDKMDLLEKFIYIIAEKCDDSTAEEYIKDLAEGRYASLMRRDEGKYLYVGERYIRELYQEAKVQIAKGSQTI